VQATACAVECGDGIIDPAEFCDDGVSNLTGEGTCNGTCDGYQTCGDGVVEGTEACDGVGCKAQCEGPVVCGDGELDPGEACDDGPSSGSIGYCNATCDGYLGCGDGQTQGNEVCDNGALNGGDPCTFEAVVADGVRFCVVSTSKSWSDAEAACVAAGGHLAKVNTSAKNAAVAALINFGSWGGGTAHIGLARWQTGPACNNQFRWRDGSSEGAFVAWAEGHPSVATFHPAVGCSGDTPYVYMDDSGAWYNADDDARPYICTVPEPCASDCRSAL